MTSAKQLSKIHHINLKESFEEQLQHFWHIHLTADTLFKTLSIEGIDLSTSRQPQNTNPSHLEKLLAKHILDSTKEGISSVLVRMDGSGFLHDNKKITLEDNIFTLRNFVIKNQTEECPGKSEGRQNRTSPELTKIKVKERLQGKDAAVIISEDDGNNSFNKSTDVYPSTSKGKLRKRKFCSIKHRTWIERWNHKKREHETTENNKGISETSETQNKTAEEKRHIPETSETLDERTEDNTDISKTCQRQGSTLEDNRNISHKEDQKERIQGLYKFWNDCGKGFNTQTSLQKHRYLHRQLKLVSDMCGQGFTFISRLKQCKNNQQDHCDLTIYA